MSGAAFEGLEHALSDKERGESYEPGRESEEFRLARRFFELFHEKTSEYVSHGTLSQTILGTKDCYRVGGLAAIQPYARRLAELLGFGTLSRQFNPNLFLEEFMLRLPQEMPDYFLDSCDASLNLLVQGLYDHGFNDFAVDVSPMVAHVQESTKDMREYGEIGTCLQGTEEAPLRLSCRGTLWRFGRYGEHCEFTLKGRAVEGGFDGRHSSYAFDCPDMRVGVAALDCVYECDSVSSLREVKGGERDDHCLPLLPDYSHMIGCAVRVRHGAGREDVRRLRRGGFFGEDWKRPGRRLLSRLKGIEPKMNNRLLVPDGEGGWTEVRP